MPSIPRRVGCVWAVRVSNGACSLRKPSYPFCWSSCGTTLIPPSPRAPLARVAQPTCTNAFPLLTPSPCHRGKLKKQQIRSKSLTTENENVILTRYTKDTMYTHRANKLFRKIYFQTILSADIFTTSFISTKREMSPEPFGRYRFLEYWGRWAWPRCQLPSSRNHLYSLQIFWEPDILPRQDQDSMYSFENMPLTSLAHGLVKRMQTHIESRRHSQMHYIRTLRHEPAGLTCELSNPFSRSIYPRFSGPLDDPHRNLCHFHMPISERRMHLIFCFFLFFCF